MKNPLLCIDKPCPGLFTSTRKFSRFSVINPFKILFAVLVFLLWDVQSIKAQYSVTEMSRYISGNSTENAVAIKNLEALLILLALPLQQICL